MNYKFIPLEFRRRTFDEQTGLIDELYENLRRRRSVRHFSTDPVPISILEKAIKIAGTAPSGANLQPWRFVVISNPEMKRKIRMAAEEEEKENYSRRFPDEWKEVLAPLGTDWRKDFLETAPYLIVVFQITYPEHNASDRKKHYYVTESVGIATGFLISSLHQAGLATLTHTPNPMGFLNKLLNRPRNERPFVLLPVGFPAEDALVPEIGRKPLEEIMQLFE